MYLNLRHKWSYEMLAIAIKESFLFPHEDFIYSPYHKFSWTLQNFPTFLCYTNIATIPESGFITFDLKISHCVPLIRTFLQCK